MKTFVLIISILEYGRGYAITNVPGYESLDACKAAMGEIVKPPRAESVHGQCVSGPSATPAR